jgi:SM-20-related protein
MQPSLRLHHPRAALLPPPRPAADAAFALNPDLDIAALAAEYRARGRVRIYGFLGEGALELYDFLQASADWIHLINDEAGVIELDAAARARLDRRAWRRIEEGAFRRSRDAFQYRYEAIRVPAPDESRAEGDLLARYARFMHSAPVLDCLSRITGAAVARFTDGQATSYGIGDFLTCHDDAVDGKERLAAYVYGLTPGWRIEWGGLLLFHGEQDRTAEALAPRFNTLDLFAVPAPHSVSLVTPAAPHRRYAVTGWLCPPERD